MAETVLAIDFGTKRVGVALATSSLAEPLVVLPNNDQLFDTLVQLCQEHHVTQLVVGLSERTMAILTQRFAEELTKRTQLPLEYIDESYSSEALMFKLRQGPMKRARRQGPIDHYVAAELLQEWLDSN